MAPPPGPVEVVARQTRLVPARNTGWGQALAVKWPATRQAEIIRTDDENGQDRKSTTSPSKCPHGSLIVPALSLLLIVIDRENLKTTGSKRTAEQLLRVQIHPQGHPAPSAIRHLQQATARDTPHPPFVPGFVTTFLTTRILQSQTLAARHVPFCPLLPILIRCAPPRPYPTQANALPDLALTDSYRLQPQRTGRATAELKSTSCRLIP
ncbi:uncharacterized protein CLUP02_03154 [Colletotrichum lupini]|uniref:Uncharacterized protein n=1 Tax=Colletotrichum lupini TaxID=145971 RepID=A0A9Q8SIC0_9PEZI|nr:uncharacterized protein CLUP02_03154 [Colletotrichum lupini]UQC77683.1 hypothetical protein CLUP02_03154 [Colletotrichum lupini]